MSIPTDIQTNILLLDKQISDLNIQIEEVEVELELKEWNCKKIGKMQSSTYDVMRPLTLEKSALKKKLKMLKNQHDEIAYLIKKIGTKLY